MINIGCYDLTGKIREEFKKVPFINDSSNIKFFPENNDRIYDLFSREAIDIMFVVDDEKHLSAYDFVCYLKENHPEIQIIFLSDKSDFKSVRKAFLYGISDYILLPLEYYQIEETINNLVMNHTDFYLSKKILDKLDGMLKFIFKGGQNINEYIDSLVNMVFTDFSDNFSRQTVVEKIKFSSYKSMIARKPWLEKFLYKENYTKKVGFDVKERDDILRELQFYYSELCWIFRKYNIIDDNPVTYLVGKYIICHVDERLSLTSVSKAVGLNPSYVSHIFKEKTGVSFTDYLGDVKIERAKVFLRNPKADIKTIAMDLDFSSTSYFAKVFSAYVGIQPNQYQKKQAEVLENHSPENLYLHRWRKHDSL